MFSSERLWNVCHRSNDQSQARQNRLQGARQILVEIGIVIVHRDGGKQRQAEPLGLTDMDIGSDWAQAQHIKLSRPKENNFTENIKSKGNVDT